MFGICAILVVVGAKYNQNLETQQQQSENRHVQRFYGSAENYVGPAIQYDESRDSPFIDGLYSGYYKQYNRNYSMRSFEMEFNDGVASGQGSDSVGDHRINGIYSDETRRMALDKTYIEGTGNLSENYGHTVKIRLQYQNESNRFEGRWYVKTYKYEGSGSWVMSKCGNLNKVASVKTETKDDNKYQTVNIIEEGETVQ